MDNQLKTFFLFRRLLLLWLGVHSIPLMAQPPMTELERDYSAYFSGPQEAVFLHLNKTHFFKGEHLWYSAYAYDLKDQLPSEATRNTIVAVYSMSGEELRRQTVNLQEGVGHSQIQIDSTWTDSIYVVRAASLRALQKPTLGIFEQQIRIIQDQVPDGGPEGTQAGTGDAAATLEVVSEGGAYISGMQNTSVVRLSGLSAFELRGAELWLADPTGSKVVSGIALNEKGFGKFDFTWENGQTYFLHARLKDGTELRSKLPAALQTGVGLRLNTLHPEYVHLSILFPENAFEEPYHWAIHSMGYMDLQPLEFTEGTGNRIEKRIDRADIPSGVNTVTVFDSEFRPLAQRLFYNSYPRMDRSPALKAEVSRIGESDSLQIELAWEGDTPASHSLSISVLPANTKAYTPQHNLISSFRFKPHVDQRFSREQISVKESRAGRYEMDLFLAHAGEGSLDWNQVREAPPESYRGEDPLLGYTGRVSDADLTQENQVWAVTDKGKDAFVMPLDRNKTFEGQSVFYEGDTLRLSLMGRNGRLRQGNVELSWNVPRAWSEAIPSTGRLLALPPSTNENSREGLDFSGDELQADDPRTIALEQVDVSAKRARNYIPINSANVVGKPIGLAEIKRSPSLGSYLRSQGFKVRIFEGSLVPLSRTPVIKYGGPVYVRVPVFVNGMRSDGYDLSMPMSNVASVFYDAKGISFISVQLRRDNYFIENRERYTNFVVKQGYTRPIPFRNPLSWNTLSDAFEDYGQVHWEPRLRLAANTPASFTFQDTGQQELLLHIEGMGVDGDLLSRTLLVTLPPE